MKTIEKPVLNGTGKGIPGITHLFPKGSYESRCGTQKREHLKDSHGGQLCVVCEDLSRAAKYYR